MEARHLLASHLGNLEHFRQLFLVAREQVEEREPIKVLCLLIGDLDDLFNSGRIGDQSPILQESPKESTHLVVPLLQRLRCKSVPKLLLPNRLSGLERDIEIPAFDSEVKARVLILDKVERNLRVPFLLEVCNNALSDQVRGPDDVQDLVVVVPHQRELEPVLGRVNRNRFGSC